LKLKLTGSFILKLLYETVSTA